MTPASLASPSSEQPPDDHWRRVAICVSASDGDAAALDRVAGSPDLSETAQRLRLGPALALAAESLSVEPDDRWRSNLQSAMTAWLVIDRAAADVARLLAESDVRWAPIKGFDVGTRFYEPRERRPTSDLDILVDGDGFARARQALEANGWRSLATGRRVERYMRDEGYAWQATGPVAALLEVHFRLWGMVPEGLDVEALDQSVADIDLGATGRRLQPEHAFVLAAVHAWTQESPRALNDWRDLERIAGSRSAGLCEGVIEAARRWSLELPISMSAAVVEQLWSSEYCGEIRRALGPDLRRPERRLLRRLSTGGIDAVAWWRIVLARLTAGRPSRAGWMTVWRRVWAHPGSVERATPAEWSWPRRRLHHLARSVGLR